MIIQEIDEQAKAIDTRNMLGVLETFYTQLKAGYILGNNVSINVANPIDFIMIAGVGDSAVPGDLIKSYLAGVPIPILVVRDHDIPSYATKNTLAFCISYSGNSEETVDACKAFWRKGSRIVGITSGGKLDLLCQKQNSPVIKLPTGYQPRQAYGFITAAIIRVLENIGFITDQSQVIDRTIETLRKTGIFKEKAYELSGKLVDRIPIIYCSQRVSVVSNKWKINFNQNSKVHSFSNVMPEANHNDIASFEDPKAAYYAILIRDDEDHTNIKKGIEAFKAIVKSRGIPVTEINVSGKDQLTKLMSSMYIGDWTSYYLAIRNNVDPTPLILTEQFKAEMSK